jgi:hypothetical protein
MFSHRLTDDSSDDQTTTTSTRTAFGDFVILRNKPEFFVPNPALKMDSTVSPPLVTTILTYTPRQPGVLNFYRSIKSLHALIGSHDQVGPSVCISKLSK